MLSKAELKSEIGSVGSMLLVTADLVEKRHAEQAEGSWARVWLFVLGMHLRLCIECCKAVQRELQESNGKE